VEARVIRDFFYDIVKHPWQAARNWKGRTGGAVVGWLPADVPEELVMAAGALPVGILGGEGLLSRADAHLPVWACSFARSSLELGLRGELDFLDGLVMPLTCDTLRLLAGIWEHCLPELRVHPYLIAHQVDRPSAGKLVRAEILRLKKALEKLIGREITGETLKAAIELNRSCKQWLKRFYKWHRLHPEALSGEDLFVLLRAATLLPKEDLLSALSALAGELGLEPGSSPETSGAVDAGKHPVYLSGSVAAPPGIFRLLDEAGLAVAGDDLHHGGRYLVPVGEGSDPIEQLAARQLALPPTGYLNSPQADRPGRLVKDVRRAGARGVIFLHLRFCEPENYDYYQLNQALEREGIPSLRVETDFQGSSLGQIRTRLEAFAEMLGVE